MKRIILFLCLSTSLGIGFIGCETSGGKPDTATSSKSESDSNKENSSGEPDYVTVQHCLIGFQGSLPDKPIKRSKEEAKVLAEQLLEKLKAGANFDEIIIQYTDDSPPGIYKMSNRGVISKLSRNIHRREDMVAAFGDTGFPLQVGEYGLAEHHPKKSPFGWHIVKRIE